MTAATQDASTHNAATGPKTAAGKAISARTALAGPEGATTHGLFCRQTVLPHLGEDPAGFQKLLDTLHEQLRPRNLMESQYLELWADASWKLRRLSRLEAQVWEDSLDEDARLAKLERLIRLQTSLRRQLDRAVRMLSQDVPNLFAHRTREDILAKLHLTEAQCAENPYREQDVERAIQANRHWPAPAADFTDGLDNTPPADGDSKNCQNEPAACTGMAEMCTGMAEMCTGMAEMCTGMAETCTGMACHAPTDAAPALPHPRSSVGEGRSLATGERGTAATPKGVLEPPTVKNCKNEPAPVPSPLSPPELGAGGPSSPCSEGPHPSPHAPRRQELQELEDMVNSGALTSDECRDLLMSENIPGFSLESGGRITIHK